MPILRHNDAQAWANSRCSSKMTLLTLTQLHIRYPTGHCPSDGSGPTLLQICSLPPRAVLPLHGLSRSVSGVRVRWALKRGSVQPSNVSSGVGSTPAAGGRVLDRSESGAGTGAGQRGIAADRTHQCTHS